jgi:hypothetical protein
MTTPGRRADKVFDIVVLADRFLRRKLLLLLLLSVSE